MFSEIDNTNGSSMAVVEREIDFLSDLSLEVCLPLLAIRFDLRSANTSSPMSTVRRCCKQAVYRDDGVQLLMMNASGVHCCCALDYSKVLV